MAYVDDTCYIKWSAENEGGIFKLACKGNMISYEIVSGSSIPFESLVGFLWHWPGMEQIRDISKSLRRENRWRVSVRKGMSGCVDWRIQHLTKSGLIRSTKVLHESCNSKANESFSVWLRDLFDLLWHFEKEGLYKSAFDDADNGVGFVDITDKLNAQKEEFLKDSFEEWQGYGSEKYEIDEELLYK